MHLLRLTFVLANTVMPISVFQVMLHGKFLVFIQNLICQRPAKIMLGQLVGQHFKVCRTDLILLAQRQDGTQCQRTHCLIKGEFSGGWLSLS